MNNNTFCILPWVHTHIKPNKDVHICCRKSIPLGNLNKNSLNEIFNSKKMDTIRSKMLNGEKVEGCEKCYHCENLNNYSMRKMMNLWFLELLHNNNITPWKDDVIYDGTNYDYDWVELFKNTPKKIKWLAIHASNICNLSCRGCYSMLSSKWKKDELNLGINPHPLYDDNLSTFNINFEDIEFITMYGGEPLIMKQNDQLADILLSTPNLSNKILQYYTNGTIMVNSKILELWKKVRYLHLNVSIDDYGEYNDYFRFGSKWDDVQNNLKQYIKYKNKYGWQLSIATVINIHNVEHLDLLYNFLIDMGINSSQITYNLCIIPEELDIRNLPDEYKELIINKYKTLDIPENLKYLVLKHIKLPSRISNLAVSAFNKKLNELRNQETPNTHLKKFL